MELTPKITEKTWNHVLEKDVFSKWEKEKTYSLDLNASKFFTIDTPPPYPSGRPWHVGAAAHYSQIDMIARISRMFGHVVHFPIGIDRNGLPVELYTEKKYGIKIRETPREKFLEHCSMALDDLEAEMIATMKSMGLSGDFSNYYRTDSEEYRKLTQATFISLWKKGMIYEDTRPNNYCTVCGTTIADAEIVHKDIDTQLVHIKFKLKDGGEIIIATTRPELIGSCQIIIVNPNDERYKNFVGKEVIVPLFEKEVKITAHPQAKMEFGSGAVMICSYGDYADLRLFRELGLQEIISINEEGKMTHNAGKYAGLYVKEARRKVVEDLESAGIVDRIEKVKHKTPTCERSANPIEIIPMKEFYLKQLEFNQNMRNFAETMKFHPEVHRQILLDWVDSVSIDWPISRRRFYGTEIPIWYCKDCGKVHVPEPGKYYRPWKDPAPFEKCESCGSKGFIGETRIFDTWMDSSVSPLFISKYGKDDKFFRKSYPCGIRPQAKEIVRTWLYYTLLRCYQLTGQQPWEHAWIMGYGVDEKGQKMSKSKGNAVDPIPLLEKYGADAFRFWNASEASLGSDFRFSDQKIQAASKFIAKLWNLSKFVSMYPRPNKATLQDTDKWVLSELGKLVDECRKGYEDFNFFVPANRIREFMWNIFADQYVEMVKARAYGEGFSESESDAAKFTLHTCLETILKLLSPITPFVTDYISTNLYGNGVHSSKYPEIKSDQSFAVYTKEIIDFNSAVWNEKKSKGISLKDPIPKQVPSGLFRFAKDLIAMHKLSS